MTDQQAKTLEVAIEVLAQTLVGHDPFRMLQNAQRQSSDPPADWTKGFGDVYAMRDEAKSVGAKEEPAHAPPPPAAPQKPYGLAPETPANREAPPIPLALQQDTYAVRPDEKPPEGDRPIRVIIVGHEGSPVPVFLTNPSGGDGGTAPDDKDKKKPEPREKDKAGATDAIARTLGRHFAFVLGPLAAFGTILSANNSGFSVFGRAVQLIGATFAPLVLPVFALFAAALLSASDMILSKLLPALGDFYKWFLDHGLPSAAKKVEDAADAIDTGTAIKNFFTKGDLPKTADLPRFLESFGKNVAPQIPFDHVKENLPGVAGGPTGGIGTWAARQMGFEAPDMSKLTKKAGETMGASGPGKSEPKAGAEGVDKMKENLTLVYQSLQRGLGPQAARSSLTEVGKSAGLAAVGADPIEAKILKAQLDTVLKLGEVINAIKANKPEEPPSYRGYGPSKGK